MVVRKLTANVAEGQYRAPELADRLFEIADTYLSDRLLSREKHGATASTPCWGSPCCNPIILRNASAKYSRFVRDGLSIIWRSERGRSWPSFTSRFPEPRIRRNSQI